MWECPENPDHKRFSAAPKSVTFSDTMRKWEMHDWQDVTCTECGALAEYKPQREEREWIPGMKADEPLTGEERANLRKCLNDVFEVLAEQYGMTPSLRMCVAAYTLGYMGVAYGLHAPE